MPKIVELDYYAYETIHKGKPFRYHVKTERVEVPDTATPADYPFALTAAVGEHHGIIRATEIVQ